MSRAQALLSPSTGNMRIPAIIIPPLDYGNNLLTRSPCFCLISYGLF